MPEQQLLRARIEAAEATGRNAGTNFNRVQEKVFEDIAKGLQQLSLVAAGTISLSITFLGYIVGKSSTSAILAATFLRSIPILWVLFASWIFLMITVVLGLLYRFVNAWYQYALTGHDWAQNGIAVWDAHLAHNAAGGTAIRPETPDTPISKEHMEETKQAWTETTATFASAKNRYELLIRWCRKITLSAFVIGLVFLLLFVVIVVNNFANV